MKKTLASSVAAFGESAKSKLANPVIKGEPEKQLRTPLDTLVRDIVEIQDIRKVEIVGETSLADLKIRPDFAVMVQGALVGFIEVKAPGKGADPRRFGDAHDKDQWTKLRSLPNLIYADGNSFSLWQNGEIVRKTVSFDGDIQTAGANLEAPPGLCRSSSSFSGGRPALRAAHANLPTLSRGSVAFCETRLWSRWPLAVRASPPLPPTGGSCFFGRRATNSSPTAMPRRSPLASSSRGRATSNLPTACMKRHANCARQTR
jgi:hypothetical protein